MVTQKKPRSISVRDFLIRKLAVKLMIGEDVIKSVLTHSYKSTADAMQKYHTVEISGLGKFIFKPVKAKREHEKVCHDVNCYINKLWAAKDPKEMIALKKKLQDSVEMRDWLRKMLGLSEFIEKREF